MKQYQFVQINSSDNFTEPFRAAKHTHSSGLEVLRTIAYGLKSDKIPYREIQSTDLEPEHRILDSDLVAKDWMFDFDPKPECCIMDCRSQAAVSDHGF
jgi:hypothetical protein